MVDKDGNIWASDDWPKMVHQHFVDLHKALETEIMDETSELENLSHGAMKNGGHARAVEARATLDMAVEHTKRSCIPEEYDEQLVTRKSVNLDWSTMLYFSTPRQPRESRLRWRSRCAKGMCSSVSECTQASSETSVPLDLTAHDEHVLAVREELNMHLVFFFFQPLRSLTECGHMETSLLLTCSFRRALGKKSCEPEDFDEQLVAYVDGS